MSNNMIHVVDGSITKGKSPIGTVEEQKERISAQLKRAADSEKKLVIHFHGGLVSKKDAIIGAKNLGNAYSEAGAEALFVIWPSDLINVIKSNLDEVFSKRLAIRVLRWIFKKRLRRSNKENSFLETASLLDDDNWFEQQLNSKTPFSDFDLDNIEENEWSKEEEDKYIAELSEDKEIQDLLDKTYVEANEAELTYQNKGLSLLEEDLPESLAYIRQLDPSIIAPIDDTEENFTDWKDLFNFKRNWVVATVKVLANTIKRKKKGTGHTWYATLLEEFLSCYYGDWIAGKLWGLMKKDAADAFGSKENAFGTFLLKELDALPTRPKIFLSAHSAGAIYATRLIENDTSTEGYDLGWVAPALNYAQFAELIRNHSQKIRNFRMFGMKDSLERSDTLVGRQKWIYPSSLLYFVSGICERDDNNKRIIDQSLLGMQRYYNSNYHIPRNREKDVKEVRTFLDNGNNRVIWSKTIDGAGLSSDAIDHGDFDTNKETLKSMKHLIQIGF